MNRAGTFKAGYSKKKDVVWSLPTIENSPSTEAIEVNRDQDKGAVATSENSSQATSSESKGREKVRELHMSATNTTKTEDTTDASRLATDAVLEVFRVLISR